MGLHTGRGKEARRTGRSDCFVLICAPGETGWEVKMLAGKGFAFRRGGGVGRLLLAGTIAAALGAGAALGADCPAPRQPNLPDAGQPVNLGLIKSQLREYHTAAYMRDLADVIADAQSHVAQRAANVSRPALVLDVDETALSNWAHMQADDFGYFPGGSCERLPKGPCGYNAWVHKHAAPAIAPTLALFDTAKTKAVAVFFVTGRDAGMRKATIRNLHVAGYRGWSGLVTRAADDTRRPVGEYKAEARARIEAQGFTIIANVGDQDSDLAGGYAECGFKLPNPFYFLP